LGVHRISGSEEGEGSIVMALETEIFRGALKVFLLIPYKKWRTTQILSIEKQGNPQKF